MEQATSFLSDGLTLSCVVSTPDGMESGEKRPAVIVLHGFGSTKNAGNVQTPCRMLNRLGYVTMRFDMRGCGDSEGEPGNLICLEQVSDTRNAASFLRAHSAVDPGRVAVLGSSFGAAVAIYAAAIDDDIAACISASGWGNGALKFEVQHEAPGAFEKFKRMLAEGRAYRERNGTSMMVSRYDIVPIPESLRGHVIEKSIMRMSVETAQGMFDFRPEDVVKQISPRPLLLMHSSVDSVTPTMQSVRLFERAKEPCELHLFSGTDHFMFAENNKRVHDVLTGWLSEFFPV